VLEKTFILAVIFIKMEYCLIQVDLRDQQDQVGHKDHADLKGHRDQQDQVDQVDRADHEEIKDQLGQLDRRDLADHKARKEIQALRLISKGIYLTTAIYH
jgi:hypothetical protein